MRACGLSVGGTTGDQDASVLKLLNGADVPISERPHRIVPESIPLGKNEEHSRGDADGAEPKHRLSATSASPRESSCLKLLLLPDRGSVR